VKVQFQHWRLMFPGLLGDSDLFFMTGCGYVFLSMHTPRTLVVEASYHALALGFIFFYLVSSCAQCSQTAVLVLSLLS
jgi:hypothetical protein